MDKRDALRLRTEGIELQKDMGSITSNQGVYIPKGNQDDKWTWEIGKQEDLTWLIK